MILFVYALIAPSSPQVSGRGIAGERIRAITAGRVTALAGALPRAPKPTMKNLRQYAAVVSGLAERAPAILPARFGTCLSDSDELKLALRLRQAALRRRLRAVRGRVQMTIRVVLKSDGGGGSLPGQTRVRDATPVGVGNAAARGRQHLQERAASAARARELPGFEPVRAAATRWLKDERFEKRAGVATINHLIPRRSALSYRTAVEHAGQLAGVRLIVSGPHPPYAFADNW